MAGQITLPGIASQARTEKEEHRGSMQFWKNLGCKVYSTAQARASGIALGLPDLFVMWPARKLIFPHEVKREGGHMSDDQMAFRQAWLDAGGTHLVGTLRDAVAFVEWIKGLRPTPPDPTAYFPRPKKPKKGTA